MECLGCNSLPRALPHAFLLHERLLKRAVTFVRRKGPLRSHFPTLGNLVFVEGGGGRVTTYMRKWVVYVVWSKLHTTIVKKVAQRRLNKFFFLAIGQSNPPLFSYPVPVESNHYEIKLHSQTYYFL